MTNGEMIQKVFNCEVCEPIPEDDIIHVIFSDKNDSAIGFDWSWWSTEYKEPTTKNNLSSGLEKNSKKLEKDFGELDCISRADVNQVIEEYMDEQYHVLSDRTRERAFGANAVKARINELQSVTLIRPKGHWIDKYHLFESCSAECSLCHKRSNGYAHDNGFSLEFKYFDFCPKCGSDNRETEE